MIVQENVVKCETELWFPSSSLTNHDGDGDGDGSEDVAKQKI